MGFTSGLAGSVTITLSLAYLAILTHQRNRQAQGDLLRSQAHILTALTQDSPIPSNLPPPPPTRVELAIKEREHLVATVKDKWNTEIENAVRWAQSKDWAEARENAEEGLRKLAGLPPVRKVAQELEAEVARAQAAASNASSRVSTAARRSLEESKAGAAKAAVDKKEATKGIFAKSYEKGKELVGKAKASINLAEARVETKLDNAVFETDVDKALKQRYKSGESDALKQSVEDALNERYVPIAERDNAKFRGV